MKKQRTINLRLHQNCDHFALILSNYADTTAASNPVFYPSVTPVTQRLHFQHCKVSEGNWMPCAVYSGFAIINTIPTKYVKFFATQKLNLCITREFIWLRHLRSARIPVEFLPVGLISFGSLVWISTIKKEVELGISKLLITFALTLFLKRKSILAVI